MPARFYLDEDVPRALTHELRNAGHDAVHVGDMGSKGRTDAYHLLTAFQDKRILVVVNRDDFQLLHDAWMRWLPALGSSVRHSGILCLPHMAPHDQFRVIDEFLASGYPITGNFYRYDRARNWILESFIP